MMILKYMFKDVLRFDFRLLGIFWVFLSHDIDILWLVKDHLWWYSSASPVRLRSRSNSLSPEACP